MTVPMHTKDRDGIVHRLVAPHVPESDFDPVVCGGGIVLPGWPVAGPPTCEWCKRGQVQPGWEADQ